MLAREKPRWWRKRWVAVAFLIFPAGYILNSGPSFYLVGRWPSTWRPVRAIVYAPINMLIGGYSSPAGELEAVRLYRQYEFWWWRLGVKHSGRAAVYDWVEGRIPVAPRRRSEPSR